MTKAQLATAIARHERGERWYDGDELFNAEIDGLWLGIGTRAELDELKADGIIDQAATYRPVTPQELA